MQKYKQIILHLKPIGRNHDYLGKVSKLLQSRLKASYDQDATGWLHGNWSLVSAKVEHLLFQDNLMLWMDATKQKSLSLKVLGFKSRSTVDVAVPSQEACWRCRSRQRSSNKKNNAWLVLGLGGPWNLRPLCQLSKEPVQNPWDLLVAINNSLIAWKAFSEIPKQNFSDKQEGSHFKHVVSKMIQSLTQVILVALPFRRGCKSTRLSRCSNLHSTSRAREQSPCVWPFCWND